MSASNVAVVGAGIVGLAHAWSAAQRGHRVTIFERSSRANGASVRNFGMIWPIGQPPGPARDLAMASRERWLQLASQAGLWVNPCGSIHVAHREDEWCVLREFQALAEQKGIPCGLLSAEQILARTPAANPRGLLGGLLSPTELCVNPRTAVRSLPDWLAKQFGVQCEFDTSIRIIDSGQLITQDRRRWKFDQVIVCSGADIRTLFPELLSTGAPLRRCKLQMLKTVPQPHGWHLGVHLASGLTLRHYQNFRSCPSLPALQQRIARETPELDRFGIHVMAAQNDAGEILLGDSHEYETDIEPFDKLQIDELILRELRQVFNLADWTLAERWQGIYLKHADDVAYEVEPQPGVHVCTGVGGAGMTLAFGIAERAWQKYE